MICGTAEIRKIEKVLRSAIQNGGFESTNAKLSKPTKSPWPPMRFHSWTETHAVYSSGKRPTIANRMKNGEM